MTSHKLNILTYRWHASHQYELWRLPHNFTLVQGAGTAMCDSWPHDQRPLPENAQFMDFASVNPKAFDLAILHFDENVLHPELCNGKESEDWGETFKNVYSLAADMPRVAICHGAPQYVGQYDPAFCGAEPVQVYESSRQQLVNFLGDTLVVCNSHQAEREWGFNKSTTIWHGFSPEEFQFGTHERQCLAPLESSVTKRGYALGYFALKKFKELTREQLTVDHTVTPDPVGDFIDKQAWAVAKYENYRKEIGHYALYIDTALRSPMPRSRGEAMMSGVIPLSFRNHDVDCFIQNGINGFYADTTEEMAETALYMNARPKLRQKMSAAARKTAIDVFHIDRYLSTWAAIIQQRV